MIRALTFGVFAFGAWSVVQVVDGAPAFDTAARVPGVFGDWRVVPGAAMYHRGEYLYHQAEGFLRAEYLIADRGDDPEALADQDTAAEWGAAAQVYLEEAVRLAPADALIWASLGWATAFAFEVERSREAMAISQALAPYSNALMLDRLAYVSILVDDNGDFAIPLTEAERSAVKRDFETLRHFEPRAVEFVLETEGMQFLNENAAGATGGG